MKTREKFQPWRGKMEGSEETQGEVAETVENLKLNSSCEAEEKITVQTEN